MTCDSLRSAALNQSWQPSDEYGESPVSTAPVGSRQRAGIRSGMVLLAALCLVLSTGLAQAQTQVRDVLLGAQYNGQNVDIDSTTGAGSLIGSGRSGINGLARDTDGTIYGISSGPMLVTVNAKTGATTDVVAVSPLAFGNQMRGLAISPSGVMYGVRYASATNSNYLVVVNRTTGVIADVGPTGTSLCQALEFSPGGTLYGIDFSRGNVSINTSTGLATPLTTVNKTFAQTLAFGADGTAYAASTNTLFRVDFATGVSTPIGGGGYYDLRGLAFTRVTDIQPTADAGPDQTVNQNSNSGATVTFDGSGSLHAETYVWSLADGTVIAGPTSQRTASGSVPLGTTDVILTVHNGQLSARDTVRITVNEVFVQPTADAGPDQTVQQTGPSGAPVTLDGSGSQNALSFVWSLSDGTVIASTDQPTVAVTLPVGVHEITLTAGHFSLTATDTVTITVTEDPNQPVADAGPDQTVGLTTPTGALVTLDGTRSQNALTHAWRGPGIRLTGPVVQALLGPGQYVIRLTVTNGPWVAYDTVTITVVADGTPPTLTAPDDVTAEQISADGTPVTLGEATATDDTDTNPTITNDAPAVFPLGATTVTWTATDAAQNVATATQTVTVEDTTRPSLTVPSQVTVEQTNADGTPVELGEATATDICDANPSIANDAPAVFPLGATTVLWTATDVSGNVARAEQQVTVEDTTAPSFDGVAAPAPAPSPAPGGGDPAAPPAPAPAPAPGGGGAGGAPAPPATDPPASEGGLSPVTVEQTAADGTPVGLHTPTVTDICDANPTVTNDAPAVFPLGTTTVTWTATDASGNAATAEQQVTVEDTTAPTLTVPDDVSAEQTARDGTPVDIGQATASDICDANPAVTNDAPAVFPLGTTVVTWTATDASGNVVEGQQRVTVVDTTAPALTIPPDVTAEQADHNGTPVSLVEPSATDICDADPVVSTDAESIFALGTTEVVWTATDASGNTTSEIQRVTVIDTTPPDLKAPAAVTVEQVDHAGTAVELGTPEVSDICDADPAVTNDAPAVFPLGTTTVTWTATDASGNNSTATQTVTVEDTTAPTVSAGPDLSYLDGETVQLPTPTVTDICDAAPVVTDDRPTAYPVGQTTVTFRARDASGNVGSDSIVVTVESLQDAIADLGAAVDQLPLTKGERNSLGAKLDAAAKSVAKGQRTAAINQLEAFINQVQALVRSGRLSTAQATALVARAERIIAALRAG